MGLCDGADSSFQIELPLNSFIEKHFLQGSCFAKFLRPTMGVFVIAPVFHALVSSICQRLEQSLP